MPNLLINEQSPYLLQHAHNPVHWYPWGNEAFERAAAEDKPVLVSIGYAACHWCHVMERESFEDEAVAAYMNEHFVCVKVDREEHPDVDHFYMDAVQAMTGSGGWPLNVFATPGRVPFHGGTYYPPRAAYNRPSWMQVLKRIDEIWEDQQEEVGLQAGQMLEHLRKASQKPLQVAAGSAIDAAMCRKIADNLLKMADKEKGGFGNAPKFPGTMAISFLLEHYHFTGYEPALAHALRSLEAMAAGGIYDQLGGGFARYSTDRDWLAPHFEKMLYDNALLVSCYCDAYSLTKNINCKIIIDDTLTFIERELKDKSGGYYCAIDADSEGVEGKFYTWTWEEWVAAAGDKDGIAARHFGVLPEGNWEETNILHVAKNAEELAAERHGPEAVENSIDWVKERLWAARGKRIRPTTDDKCLLGWNALVNISLSKAGAVLGNDSYLRRAGSHMQWMLQAFMPDGRLLHTWKNGVAKIPAKLDDYAYLVQALLQLAASAGSGEREQWMETAVRLTEQVIAGFGQDDLFFYYTPEGQKDMPVRKVDLYDGATPSANAVMAHNLWIAGMCAERGEWVERAGKMLRQIAETAVRHSYSFGYWALLQQRHSVGLRTIISTGPAAYNAMCQLRSKYIPQAYFLTLEKEISNIPILKNKKNANTLSIFVCAEQACLSPVSSVNEAFSLVSQK